MNERSDAGVALPRGHTGSSLFHSVLKQAVDEFPEVLGGVELPDDPKRFKQRYGEVLVRFEAARAGSARRVEIARFIARRTQHHLQLVDASGAAPLQERLAVRAEPPPLRCETGSGSPSSGPGLRVEVPFEGRTYRGREVIELAQRLRSRHQMTDAALRAVQWTVQQAQDAGGTLSLAGQRFALLGAGAELAPTPMLLAAGADVLWIDVVEPSQRLGGGGALSGRLWRAEGVSDVLRQPREIAAAIAAFAADGPVHVGMFAYAAGESREWRLAAAMNAIVRSLDASVPASVSLFVSPTTAANMQPEDLGASAERLRARPAWQSALCALGALPTPGHFEQAGRGVSRSIVSIQGLSYQAAQYISKICAAESYAVYGLPIEGDAGKPLTVSANVAGITNTRSLAHPLFQAAFVGAGRFGVQIFEPATTRALGALLMLHDLQNPRAPGAAAVSRGDPCAKVADMLSQQLHGGIYGLPYALEPAIRASALIGMARKPSVLFR